MNLILNQSQAAAVYSAMCALNNVGGRIEVRLPNARVYEHSEGISIEGGISTERHASQSAFATAYGLKCDERRGQKYTTNRYCHANMCLESDKQHECDCPQGR